MAGARPRRLDGRAAVRVVPRRRGEAGRSVGGAARGAGGGGTPLGGVLPLFDMQIVFGGYFDEVVEGGERGAQGHWSPHPGGGGQSDAGGRHRAEARRERRADAGGTCRLEKPLRGFSIKQLCF